MTATAYQANTTQHYWMLWVAPSAEQTQHIRSLPESQRQRVLMLHPKNLGQVCQAIKTAIESDLYQAITLPAYLLSTHQQKQLEVMALKHGTILSWTDKAKQLNNACQLSLI